MLALTGPCLFLTISDMEDKSGPVEVGYYF